MVDKSECIGLNQSVNHRIVQKTDKWIIYEKINTAVKGEQADKPESESTPIEQFFKDSPKHKNKTALVYLHIDSQGAPTRRAVSYGELLTWTEPLAEFLSKITPLACFQHEGQARVVSLLSAGVIEYLLTTVACFRKSILTFPLLSRFSPEKLNSMLASVRSEVLCISLESLAFIKRLIELLSKESTLIRHVIVFDYSVSLDFRTKDLLEDLKRLGSDSLENPTENRFEIHLFSEILNRRGSYSLETTRDIFPKDEDLLALNLSSGTCLEPKIIKLRASCIKQNYSTFRNSGYLFNSDSSFLLEGWLSHQLPLVLSLITLFKFGVVVFRLNYDFKVDSSSLDSWGYTLRTASPASIKKLIDQARKYIGLIDDKEKPYVSSELEYRRERLLDSKSKTLEEFFNTVNSRLKEDSIACKHMKAIKAYLGAGVKVIIHGGAPASADWLDEFKVLFGIPNCNVYGLTELGAVFVSHMHSKANSLGQLGEYFQAKVLIEKQQEDSIQGELLIKGGNEPYFNSGKKQLKEGFFSTGDSIRVDTKDNSFRYVDRLVNIISLSSGFKIHPSTLEEFYSQSAYIDSIVVLTQDMTSSFVTAIATKSHEYKDIPNKELYPRIREDFRQIALRKGLQWEEHLRFFVLLEPGQGPSEENGCLSKLGKVSRPTVKERYREELSGIYNSAHE